VNLKTKKVTAKIMRRNKVLKDEMTNRWYDFRRGKGHNLSVKDLQEMRGEACKAHELLKSMGGYDLALYRLVSDMYDIDQTLHCCDPGEE